MIAKSGNRFSEKIMLQQELDQDDDSTQRHPDPSQSQHLACAKQ